jgi:hypothetical protein
MYEWWMFFFIAALLCLVPAFISTGRFGWAWTALTAVFTMAALGFGVAAGGVNW